MQLLHDWWGNMDNLYCFEILEQNSAVLNHEYCCSYSILSINYNRHVKLSKRFKRKIKVFLSCFKHLCLLITNFSQIQNNISVIDFGKDIS